MAAARLSTRASVSRARPAGVRWDRLGRIAMLLVLLALLYLYLGAARSYLSSTQQAHRQGADIRRLESDNARLRARRSALERPSALEQEARQLGMIRPGERPYVIEGLPPN
ncbi:MAG: hypothetical protein E6G56_12775 [Actinobacteria bacterium]|nr:MAG: hypothetical protein E6G56_12775 [Actinomycetota bacterium]